MKILDKVNYPKDLKKLSLLELESLAKEIREFLVKTLNISGGHLASGLGVTELTIALHKYFNTPFDKIIWDTGHQSYIHKILTGRKNKLSSIKKKDGISGFPSREESEYDCFGTAHSSTSISAALGFKIANPESKVVAVIGDGALTSGIAFEALNNIGYLKTNILVIINDNHMSISENVGALSTLFYNYYERNNVYENLKEHSKKILKKIPPLLNITYKAKKKIKEMVSPKNFFENLGFYYEGIADGHSLDDLIRKISHIDKIKGPKVFHIKTIKGKGLKEAENNPINYHSVKKGFINKESTKKQNIYSDIFGKWIVEKASKDKNLIGITPAMKEGSNLVEFADKFADRYFDVSIAEQHALTFASGLACGNKKPVVAIYSTFLQRAYDQVIHDIALQNLDVLIAIDRAGVVGEDGPTHCGVFDLAYLQIIPNLTIMCPSDASELYEMLNLGYEIKSPAIVRYPKENIKTSANKISSKLIIGKGLIINEGKDIAIMFLGTFKDDLTQICEEENITLINLRFAKPLDKDLIINTGLNHKVIITIEEGTKIGGIGATILQILNDSDIIKTVKKIFNLGIEDFFPNQGKRSEVLNSMKIDKSSLIKKIIKIKMELK